MRLNYFIVKFIICLLLLASAVLADETTSSNSLSDLNFDSNENALLRDLPWSPKDPFNHPDFRIKKSNRGHGGISDKEQATKASKDKSRPSLDLTAILYSDKSSSAVINGRIVKVGSVIKGQKIVEIHKNMIKVNFNGAVYSVRLKDFRSRNNTRALEKK